MNVVIIASAIIAATFLIGILIAAAAAWFGQLVEAQQAEQIKEKESYNLVASLGLEIPVDADKEEQLKAARELAAKRAAALPRGGNMRIGKMGPEKQATAFDGVKEDPISAVKIASFAGWNGLHTGMAGAKAAPTKAVRAPAQTAPPAKSVEDLIPGKDYPYIEITDDMDPASKRKARIANAKARSAAVKALKESGVAAPVPAEIGTEPVAVPAAPAAAETAGALQKNEPVAGVDYKVIEITDDMDPAEVRRARIANAKARSAAMKAFKQAGGTVGSAVQEPAQMEEVGERAGPPVIAPEMGAGQSTSQVPANIQKPEYIEITDDMDPADIRSARIQNAKMKSAYNKALKAAGIDPSAIED